jgi:Ser/Thr protein kinase RdoA (MazF antagonist)
VSGGEQDVYAFSVDDARRYLRLTSSLVRSGDAVEAEVEFVRYLHREQLHVAAPVASRGGRYVEAIERAGGSLHATVFEEAPGETFRYDSDRDNQVHFRLRGRTLGRLHALSREYVRTLPNASAQLPRWNETGWVRAAGLLVPESDEVFWSEFRAVSAWMSSLPIDASRFGLIHGDFGVTNYRVAGDRVTVFDFGDACRHWFAHDVAISVYPYGERPERDVLLAATLEGYATESPVTNEWVDTLGWFCRLRVVHMYVVYAQRWGLASHSPQHEEWCERKRARMRAPIDWRT